MNFIAKTGFMYRLRTILAKRTAARARFGKKTVYMNCLAELTIPLLPEPQTLVFLAGNTWSLP